MKHILKSVNLIVIILNLITAHPPLTAKSKNFFQYNANNKSAHISPELINELEDFKNLIPTATIDALVAKHYFFDGNFRTALNYLRSEEFNQLQKQLLDVPEILDILEFLHLTVDNATTRHLRATKMSDDAVADSENGYIKITKNTISVITDPDRVKEEAANVADPENGYIIITKDTISLITDPDLVKEEAANVADPENGYIIITKDTISVITDPDNVKEDAAHVTKTRQKRFSIEETNNKSLGSDNYDNDDYDYFGDLTSHGEHTLVNIVLLKDLEEKPKVYNKVQQHQQHNSYHHSSSLGTFISFVEEVLEHLPISDYQKMITDKCIKNRKFADFYHALRGPFLKPFIEKIKTTPNIQKIITTLRSHDVDINSLEPIAFKVISWGPQI